MRSYSRKRKNNIIIGTLCGVMLLMVVGYAAFASQLNIKGTSGISSNWDIEITNIRGGNPNGGDAYDISEPTYTRATATFNTGLKTPDTSRMYEVEVTNKGTLTGLVTIANLSCGDNDAIGCDASADKEKIVDDNWEWLDYDQSNEQFFEQGQQDYSDIAFTLAPGEKHYIYVMVMYNDVTSQPENLSANINLELTYEQEGLDENGIAIPPTVYTVNYVNMWKNTSYEYKIEKTSDSCVVPKGETSCTIILPQIFQRYTEDVTNHEWENSILAWSTNSNASTCNDYVSAGRQKEAYTLTQPETTLYAYEQCPQ